MDFGLTEEQSIFRDSVARFLGDEYPFDQRQKIVAESDGFRDTHWRQFAELGWLAASFPEAHGGLGGGAVETALIMEQFGRFLVTGPYLSTVVLGGTVLLQGGSQALKDRLLPAIVAGETRLTFAHEEPGSWQNPAYVTARAQAFDGGYTLDGTKANAAFAETADHIVVTARSAGEALEREGVSVFVVPRDAEGLSVTPYRTQDGGRAGEVVLSGVQVDTDALLGAEGQGLSLTEAVLDAGCAAVCAEAVGAMWAIHEQTLDYLKTREQFGQKLGEFQALQHRMVDMYMACQLAQSLTMDAVAALDRGVRNDIRQAVSAAKSHVGRACRQVGQEGIQLHGGIGMTMEMPIGHYFKRLTAIGLSFGDAAYHRQRYVQDQWTAN